MSNLILITCKQCGKEHPMPKKEHTRKEKAGRTDHFCSLGCSTSYYNIKHDKGHKAQSNLNVGYDKSDEFTPFRYYLRKAQTRGKERGMATDLDLPYLKELWDKQNGCCAYSGIGLMPWSEKTRGDKNPFIASLDRIDSTQGYWKGNVQYVSIVLNLAKKDMDENSFRNFLRLVASNIMNS